MLREKFEAVLGPCEGYSAMSKSAYNSFYSYQEPHGHNPQFYNAREERNHFKNDESYAMSYEKKPNWYGNRADKRGDYDEQDFVSSETDRIIKGVYNLMKKDTPVLRNTDAFEVTDLRMKLNHLAEENARYRCEFGRANDGERHRPWMPTVPGTDDYKLQDVVRRLERDNIEMRRQLNTLQERNQNYFAGGYNKKQVCNAGVLLLIFFFASKEHI